MRGVFVTGVLVLVAMGCGRAGPGAAVRPGAEPNYGGGGAATTSTTSSPNPAPTHQILDNNGNNCFGNTRAECGYK